MGLCYGVHLSPDSFCRPSDVDPGSLFHMASLTELRWKIMAFHNVVFKFFEQANCIISHPVIPLYLRSTESIRSFFIEILEAHCIKFVHG